MEVYLSHMVIFRVIEKLHLNTVLGHGWLQYAVTVVLTICGAVIFSVISKMGLEAAIKIVGQKLTQR